MSVNWWLFAIAFVVCWGAVPIAAWWEHRQDARDRALWDEMFWKPHGPQYQRPYDWDEFGSL
jgi:hypothetical protein